MEIASNSVDVIVLTETRLDRSITDIEIFGREYCIKRKDRQQEGRFAWWWWCTNCQQRIYIKASPREDLACESE